MVNNLEPYTAVRQLWKKISYNHCANTFIVLNCFLGVLTTLVQDCLCRLGFSSWLQSMGVVYGISHLVGSKHDYSSLCVYTQYVTHSLWMFSLAPTLFVDYWYCRLLEFSAVLFSQLVLNVQTFCYQFNRWISLSFAVMTWLPAPYQLLDY
jgi:hypothetical protein